MAALVGNINIWWRWIVVDVEMVRFQEGAIGRLQRLPWDCWRACHPSIHPSPHNQEILLSIHQSWGRNVSLNGSKGFWHLLWSLFTNNNNYDMSLLRVVLLSFPCVTAKEGRMVRWRPSDRPDNTLKGFWSSARSRMMEWDKLSNLSHVMLLPGHFFQTQTKPWW